MGKKIKIALGSRAPKGSKSVKAPKRVGAANMKRPQKGPKKPLPPQRRDSTSSLSSAPNLSDEDGYSAVEDIPDSDDDEDEHVFAAEMEHIMSLQRHSTAHSSPRPGLASDNDKNKVEEKGAESDDSDDELVDDGSSIFDSSVLSSEDVFLESLPDEGSDQPPERHVRFTGVPDTDSDSDETEDDHYDLYPDIFIPQSVLDSGFRRELERDDNDGDSDDSDTYWDFGNTDAIPFPESAEQQNDIHMATAYPSNSAASQIPLALNSHNGSGHTVFQPPAASDDEDGSSDGYESDGETTEEDEPVLIPRRQGTPDAPVQGDATTLASKGKSPAGRLLLSSRKKPICIVNPVTRKMMVIRPQKRARYTFPPANFPPMGFPALNAAQSSPIKNNDVVWSGSLQFSAMPMYSDPADFGYFVSNATAPDSEGSFIDEETMEEDDGEKNLNIADFIDVEALNAVCAKDDEAVEDINEEGVDGAETPSRRPSTTSNGLSGTNLHTHPLLLHLKTIDRVGAFRINQDEQKLIMNGEATQESLAFSNSLIHGTLRGIKQGNLKGAATPLTPERRPKKPFTKSPLEANFKKRKASEADNNTYKRQRSTSGAMQMHN